MKTKFDFFTLSILLISIAALATPYNSKANEETNPPQQTSSKTLASRPIHVSNNFTIKKTSVIEKAVVVKSWNSAGSELIWPQIRENWWKYGSTEVTIDDSSLIDVQSFTLQDLMNSGADVVILSNPAGAHKQFTQSEFQALTDYCSLGHNLIGTYSLLQSSSYDNRILAPLFGLNDTIQYSGGTPDSMIYYYLEPTNYLFNNINEPYESNGYQYSQIPAVGNWIISALDGAEAVGLTSDTIAVITQFNAGNFWSIYISNMPEYFGDTLDARFLYNAITFNDQFTNINDNEMAKLQRYFLEQNYPNPFNPATSIKFSIPKSEFVTLKIYNILGEEVGSLVSERLAAGSYKYDWPARSSGGDASGLASGVYLYRIHAGNYVETRKMILLR
jgi:hypothetical protein